MRWDPRSEAVRDGMGVLSGFHNRWVSLELAGFPLKKNLPPDLTKFLAPLLTSLIFVIFFLSVDFFFFSNSS